MGTRSGVSCSSVLFRSDVDRFGRCAGLCRSDGDA
jgi:hypothetical protein